jgi:stress response protein SCP2
MGKEKGKKSGKKGKKGGKKGKKGGVVNRVKNMSTRKKVLIGAGVAAVAVGGLAVGKYMYDRNKKNSGAAGLHRGVGIYTDEGPVDPYLAPYAAYTHEDQYKRSTETIPVPPAVSVGLGWVGNVNMDLHAGIYDAQGQNLGYLSGQNRTLFNNAVWHTGDDTTGTINSVIGDNENCVFDLQNLPPQVNTIVFGVLLQPPPVGVIPQPPRHSFVHVLPMFRQDVLPQAIPGAAPGTRGLELTDSSDESDSDSSEDEGSHGTRGVDPLQDSYYPDEHRFVTLFHGEPTGYPDFLEKRGCWW